MLLSASPCSVASASPVRIYEVLLVDLSDDGKTATVTPADFEDADIRMAKAWAKEFNRDELENPIGAWAVIRVREPAAIVQDGGHRRDPQTVG